MNFRVMLTRLQKQPKNRSTHLLFAANQPDPPQNPTFALEAFSAPTLRGGGGANQSVGHLNSMGKKT
jgi:hypothetical protein